MSLFFTTVTTVITVATIEKNDTSCRNVANVFDIRNRLTVGRYVSTEEHIHIHTHTRKIEDLVSLIVYTTTFKFLDTTKVQLTQDICKMQENERRRDEITYEQYNLRQWMHW